jgi:hypothetical protein
MASGDTLIILTTHSADLPTTGNVPSPDSRNDHSVLDFDAAVAQTVNFPIVLPRHYGGNGTTATIYWSATTSVSADTTGAECRWTLAWERHQDDAFDLDADGFAAAQVVVDVAPSVNGEQSYAEITFTEGGQMDSIAVGESGRLRLIRDAADGTDTMSGDAELHRIEIRET